MQTEIQTGRSKLDRNANSQICRQKHRYTEKKTEVNAFRHKCIQTKIKTKMQIKMHQVKRSTGLHKDKNAESSAGRNAEKSSDQKADW